MTSMSNLTDKSRINVYMLVLIGLLLLASILTIWILYDDGNTIRKRENIINGYHLTLVEKSGNIINAISETKLWFLENGYKQSDTIDHDVSPIRVALSYKDKIESLQYSVNRSVNEILALQSNYLSPEFEVVTELLVKTHSDFNNKIKKIIIDDDISYSVVKTIVKPLFNVTTQFRLLHVNAYKRDSSFLIEFYRTNKNNVILLIIIIVSLTATGVIGAFKKITGVLDDLQLAHDELSQKSRIIDQISDSVIATDMQGIITNWNNSSTRMFGYHSEEVIGRSISCLYAEKDKSELKNKIIPDLKKKGESRLELSLLHKSGKEVMTETSLSMIHNQENIDVGMIGYSVDIAERKKSEEQISRLASIVECSSDFIGISTIDGVPLFLNKAGRELVGIDSDILLFNTKIADIFDEEYKEILVMQIIPTVLNDGQWEGEVYFRHLGTRKIIPVWFDIFRIDDSVTGEAINFATVTRDLTESKKVEAELIKSEMRIRTLLESTPTGIFQTDINGKCIYINETYQNIAGIELQDALGEGWVKYLYPDDREAVFDEWGLSVKENRNFEMEYRMLTSSQNIIWVYAQSMAELNEQGEVISYIGTITDITENKLLGAELESYQSVLEQRVEERTRSMKEALALAERANKAKSDFISHMSHELRTPLNAILGFAQMLKLDKEDFNEEQNENVLEIYDAGQHLLSLINDVLDLAKIESGNFSIVMESVLLSDVIDESIPFIQNQADQREIKIYNNIKDKRYLVYADELKLKQVILNILSNAVKYNNDKGRITIDARLVNDERLHISIADTGDGLSKEEIPHVFDNFERLNQKDNVEGAGIGLVIAKNIIELMGGKIGVMSELSFGTVFWFEISLFKE